MTSGWLGERPHGKDEGGAATETRDSSSAPEVRPTVPKGGILAALPAQPVARTRRTQPARQGTLDVAKMQLMLLLLRRWDPWKPYSECL